LMLHTIDELQVSSSLQVRDRRDDDQLIDLLLHQLLALSIVSAKKSPSNSMIYVCLSFLRMQFVVMPR
jgi:hypothetical protein